MFVSDLKMPKKLNNEFFNKPFYFSMSFTFKYEKVNSYGHHCSVDRE
jgi:hypothetical protein